MYSSFMEVEHNLLQRGIRKTVALANAQDHESLGALLHARSRGVVDAILIGDAEKITGLLHSFGENPADFTIIPSDNEVDAALCAAKLVTEGKADIPLKGNMQTASFMKAILNKELGFVAPGALLSQGTVLEWREQKRLLFFGDCAINIAPDLEAKVKITANLVRLAQCFGVECPKVAVISAVETVKEKIPSTVDAAALASMDWKDCIVRGPFGLDNAVSREAALHKGITDPVAGNADILLLPDLCTGNVFTKSMTFFAHLSSAGAVCGPQLPVIMTSRTDTEENKYYSILTAILQSLR